MEVNKELVFSSTEEVVKVYRYFSLSSNDKEIGDYSNTLTVTTDRVVIESINKGGFVRDEYPIDSIEGTKSQFYYSKKSKAGLVLFIIGLVIIGLGFGLKDILANIFGFMYLIFAGVGLALFIVGLILLIKLKAKQSFRLTLFTCKQFYSLTTLSGENFISKKRKRNKETAKIKIVATITEDALKMLNELNGVFITVKHFKEEVACMRSKMLNNIISVSEFEENYARLLSAIKK